MDRLENFSLNNPLLEFTTVVCPMEKCLPLSLPAKHISHSAVLAQLRDVPHHETPTFDLSRIFYWHAAPHIVATVPLEPPTRIIGVYPPLRLPY